MNPSIYLRDTISTEQFSEDHDWQYTVFVPGNHLKAVPGNRMNAHTLYIELDGIVTNEQIQNVLEQLKDRYPTGSIQSTNVLAVFKTDPSQTDLGSKISLH
ncbi:hypothetical protein ACKWTF_004042 [Chironomus riparius]